MRVLVESVLPCDRDIAFAEVSTSRLLLEVAAPLIDIRPVPGETLPDCWQAGSTIRVRSFFLGFIPLGTRVLNFERIDPVTCEIQTRESDPLIRRWDHLISIRTLAKGRCRYRDLIEIEAGLLTFMVWLFAQWFYRHRQHRWKSVAKRLQTSRRVGTSDLAGVI